METNSKNRQLFQKSVALRQRATYNKTEQV